MIPPNSAAPVALAVSLKSCALSAEGGQIGHVGYRMFSGAVAKNHLHAAQIALQIQAIEFCDLLEHGALLEIPGSPLAHP